LMIEDFPAILKAIFDPNYGNIRPVSQSIDYESYSKRFRDVGVRRISANNNYYIRSVI
jgi:hypothetical protein